LPLADLQVEESSQQNTNTKEKTFQSKFEDEIGKLFVVVVVMPSLNQVPSLVDLSIRGVGDLVEAEAFRVADYVVKNFMYDEFEAAIRCQSYETFNGRNLRIFVISYIVCAWQAFPACSNVWG
jgi:hypothetical protein